MRKPKLEKPKYPPIDWLKAAILERKSVMKLGWEDIADYAGVTCDVIRALASKKHTEDWPANIRKRVCSKLGIEAKLVITGAHENEY